MKILTSFVLIGVIDSYDQYFATVELNTNPETSAIPAIAVMPVSSFPCEISEGQIFYIIKNETDEYATVICHKIDNETR
jgi:hypothetical protein